MDIVITILTGAVITLVCGLAFLALTAPRTEAELGYEAFMDSDPARFPPVDEPGTGWRAQQLSSLEGASVFFTDDDEGSVIPISAGRNRRAGHVLYRVK